MGRGKGRLFCFPPVSAAGHNIKHGAPIAPSGLQRPLFSFFVFFVVDNLFENGLGSIFAGEKRVNNDMFFFFFFFRTEGVNAVTSRLVSSRLVGEKVSTFFYAIQAPVVRAAK